MSTLNRQPPRPAISRPAPSYPGLSGASLLAAGTALVLASLAAACSPASTTTRGTTPSPQPAPAPQNTIATPPQPNPPEPQPQPAGGMSMPYDQQAPR